MPSMNNNMMSMMMINSTDFFQSLPSSLDHNLSSLFLGDLSIYSTEKDIRQLFKNYGVIETVRIKRGSSGKPHLSYGFIKFRDRESAERALRELNGTVFLGRALRLGWAEPKSNTKVLKSRKDAKPTETAQIHVSFISKQVDALITEATLRGLFSMYGEVVDVAIKKTQFDKKLRIQNGYGFVHFALTPEGVRSAVNATNAIHQVTIDRVTYDCSLSHALEQIVAGEVSPPQGSPVPFSPSKHRVGSSTSPIPGFPSPMHLQQQQQHQDRVHSPQHSFAPPVNQFNRPPLDVNQLLPPLPPHHHPTIHPIYQPSAVGQEEKSVSPSHANQSGSYHYGQIAAGNSMGSNRVQPPNPPSMISQMGTQGMQQNTFYQGFPAMDNSYGIAEMNRSHSSDFSQSSGFPSINSLDLRINTGSAYTTSGSVSSSDPHNRTPTGFSNAYYQRNSGGIADYVSDTSSDLGFEDLSLHGNPNFQSNRVKASPTGSLRSSISTIGSMTSGGARSIGNNSTGYNTADSQQLQGNNNYYNNAGNKSAYDSSLPFPLTDSTLTWK